MAVKLNSPTELLPIKGIRLASTAAQIRYRNRNDLLLMSLVEGSTTAAVFTQNKYCAAPVIIAREHLQKTQPRALLINAGNANAGTGKEGLDNVVSSCEAVATSLGLDVEQILPFSTGVIGEQLPMDKVVNGVSEVADKLSEDNWLEAAATIMTTDTVAKGVSEQFEIDGEKITITGIVKGSGMICPNMATLLSYVATDANIPSDILQVLLERATEASFNRITVDSDTSTNDALVLIATGQSNVDFESLESETIAQFYSSLKKVLVELATAVVRDGEGATKFVEVEIIGGKTKKDCATIAYSIAHSPLVKTALFASDPNWGRILAAIGKADVNDLNIETIDISINGQPLIKAGEPAPSYNEEIGQQIFQQDEITINVNLNLGKESYNVWTSDLSHEYVSINADYRS